MQEKVFNTIAMAENGVYEIYTIDHKAGTCMGYKCFPAFGESNPCRTFINDKVVFYNMRTKRI